MEFGHIPDLSHFSGTCGESNAFISKKGLPYANNPLLWLWVGFRAIGEERGLRFKLSQNRVA